MGMRCSRSANPRSSARGFSLIEILISLLITVTGVLTTVSIFPVGITSVQASGDSLQAQAIAQQYLDLIREYYQTESNPPLNYPPGQSWTVTAVIGQQFRDQAQTSATYTLQYTATNLATSSAPTPEHDIVLTISWSNSSGTHARTYEEYVQN